MNVLAFIPARLESKRFPNKVLKSINNIPMIEHVRRRALLSGVFKDVLVVTNSKLLKKKLKEYKAKVIITKKRHVSGTSRISEISKNYEFDYGCILFADEPFINPSKLSICLKKLRANKKEKVFNLTTDLKLGDLESNQVVKTVKDEKGYIVNYFRKLNKNNFQKNITKSSGILIFKKDLIDNYNKLKIGKKEKKLNIEQFKILENNIKIKSIFISNIYPSINTKKEFNNLLSLIYKNKKEVEILERVIKFES